MPNPLIAEYGETIVRKTTAPGSYNTDTGEWQTGALTSESILAAVLPLSANDLLTEVKPEGFENNHGISIYSDSELKETDEAAGQAPDEITWRGRDYVIFVVSHRYQIPTLAHYKAIAFLKNS